jgi:hypoxanthine phosphoribosyltransferase
MILIDDKVSLSFTEISRRLRALQLPLADQVVGIGRGGIVPAALLAHQLGLPLTVLSLNYRDDANQPRHEAPQRLAPVPDLPAGAHLLLVDDVSVTGRTLDAAKALLPGHPITTVVLKGQGDYVLFPEVPECVLWPWRPELVNAVG